jgi:hypothetical protein
LAYFVLEIRSGSDCRVQTPQQANLLRFVEEALFFWKGTLVTKGIVSAAQQIARQAHSQIEKNGPSLESVA